MEKTLKDAQAFLHRGDHSKEAAIAYIEHEWEETTWNARLGGMFQLMMVCLGRKNLAGFYRNLMVAMRIYSGRSQALAAIKEIRALKYDQLSDPMVAKVLALPSWFSHSSVAESVAIGAVLRATSEHMMLLTDADAYGGSPIDRFLSWVDLPQDKAEQMIDSCKAKLERAKVREASQEKSIAPTGEVRERRGYVANVPPPTRDSFTRAMAQEGIAVRGKLSIGKPDEVEVPAPRAISPFDMYRDIGLDTPVPIASLGLGVDKGPSWEANRKANDQITYPHHKDPPTGDGWIDGGPRK